MKREERPGSQAAARHLAEQISGEADSRAGRGQRIVREAGAEAEIARRIHAVDIIQPVPSLIRAHLERVPALNPRQTVGGLDRVMLAITACESAARRTDGQNTVDHYRREGVLRNDGWE